MGITYRSLVELFHLLHSVLIFKKMKSNIKNSLFAQGSSVDMGVFSTQGRYRAPERLKNINMTITLYHPNGTQLKPVINLSNMFLLTFEDIKYSYSSLTDYQKYSCTFVCDPVNFSIDSFLESVFI